MLALYKIISCPTVLLFKSNNHFCACFFNNSTVEQEGYCTIRYNRRFDDSVVLFVEKFKSLDIVFADASDYQYSFIRDISYIR